MTMFFSGKGLYIIGEDSQSENGELSVPKEQKVREPEGICGTFMTLCSARGTFNVTITDLLFDKRQLPLHLFIKRETPLEFIDISKRGL